MYHTPNCFMAFGFSGRNCQAFITSSMLAEVHISCKGQILISYQ